MLVRCLIISSVFFGASAFAKGYSPAVTAAPGGYNIKYASDGTPLGIPATNKPGGGAQITSPVNISLAGGINYPAVVTAVITAAAMVNPYAAAIAAAIAVGGVGYSFLDDLMNAQRIRRLPNAGGLEIDLSPTCTAGVCREFQSPNGSWSGSAAVACNAFAAHVTANSAYNQTVKAQYPTSCLIVQYWKTTGAYSTEYPHTPPTRTVAGTGARYEPITTVGATTLLTGNAPTAAEVQAMVDANFPPIPEPAVITGPASVAKFNSIDMGLDGTIKEINERYIASFSPGLATFTVSTTTTIKKPGTVATTTTTNSNGTTATGTISTPGVSSTLTATSVMPTPAAPVEPTITCGLPGTPACKIDESGTNANAGTTFDSSKTAIDAAKADAQSAINNASGIPAPSWSFSFQFPTGCAPFQTGIRGFILNVCPYQSQIHSLLSAIWAASTIFAMIGMVGRTIRNQ